MAEVKAPILDHDPLPGQLVLLARPPDEEGSDESAMALRVPREATLPLLRALRRSLEATRAEVNGDRAMWSTLFERFGAGGNDLVAPSQCSDGGEGGEALRVRLAAAEARLAAASLRHEEELQDLREALAAKTGQADEGPRRSPPSLSRPPRTARTPPRPPDAGPSRLEETLPAPAMPQQETALQNFSLSAEFWRLREALTRAEANEHQKASDMEVRRLRTALAATTAKLERYEASSTEVEEGSHPMALISLSDGLASLGGLKAERRLELFPQAEPDTARTVVAAPEASGARLNEQPSPGKPRNSQLGSFRATIRPYGRTSTSLVSPARLSPQLAPRSSSPAGPRRTVAELTASPPQRPVQLSPTPARPPTAIGAATAIQAPSPPRPPARISGSASARLPQTVPGQASSLSAPMRVYNVPVVRAVHTPPHAQATVRVVSSIQGVTTPAGVQWTTPRPASDRPVTPVGGVIQRVTPPPLAAMRKSATLSRTGSLSPPPMFARREATSPPAVAVQSKAHVVEMSI